MKRDDGQRSERTALCVRDGGKTVEVLMVKSENGEVSGPPLFALGRFLARRGCEGTLNLDGVPSTSLAFRENGGSRRSARSVTASRSSAARRDTLVRATS